LQFWSRRNLFLYLYEQPISKVKNSGGEGNRLLNPLGERYIDELYWLSASKPVPLVLLQAGVRAGVCEQAAFGAAQIVPGSMAAAEGEVR
jgi:hypothetical protein